MAFKTLNVLDRDKTIDLMRVFALIIIILLHHLPSYYFNFYDLTIFGNALNFNFICNLMRYFGIGVFVFISGYLLAQKEYNVDSISAVLIFLSNKFIRIIPLYWGALAIYIIIFYLYTKKGIDCVVVIFHFFGMQLFYIEPIFTIWFVGLIVIYYTLFAVIQYVSKDNNCDIFFGFTSFFLLIVVDFVYPTADNRIIIYWPIFLIGNWFYRSRYRPNLTVFVLSLVVTVILGWVYLSFLPSPENLLVSKKFLATVIILTALMSCFVTALLWICRNLNTHFYANIIFFMSYSSYCIYLFHTPVFQITKKLLEKHQDLMTRTIVFSIVITMLVFFSYFIQKTYDKLMVIFLKKFSR